MTTVGDMTGYGRSVSRGPRSRLDSPRPPRQPLRVVNGSTLKDLGLDVRSARKQRKWTQADLARHANVATTLVGRVERGHPVSDTTLRAIARTLDLPDTAIAPHLTEQPAPSSRPVDPATGTVGDLQRELEYFHRRFRETPDDFDRLMDLLRLYAQLHTISADSTQGGLRKDAHS